MKAKFTKTNVQNGKNYSGEKGLVSAYSVMGKVKGELREVVTCRAYMGRSRNSSVVYASLWVHCEPFYCAGHGSASGWGYHKESAAIGSAISSAGIELYGDVYNSSHKWNDSEKRENTPQEIAAIKRRLAKRRAHIGGVGESAVRAALEAIARAAGARGKLAFISH